MSEIKAIGIECKSQSDPGHEATSRDTVLAVVIGNWAAHPRSDEPGSWTVTYAPSGRNITATIGQCSAARAVVLAERLALSLPEFAHPLHPTRNEVFAYRDVLAAWRAAG